MKDEVTRFFTFMPEENADTDLKQLFPPYKDGLKGTKKKSTELHGSS